MEDLGVQHSSARRNEFLIAGDRIVVKTIRSRRRNRQDWCFSVRRFIFGIRVFHRALCPALSASDRVELTSTTAFWNTMRFKCVSYCTSFLFCTRRIFTKLPWQHSAQNLKSTLGIWLHPTKEGDWRLGILKTFLVTSRMSSLLSQMTRLSVDCLICVNCSGLKTPGFSYQNLKNQSTTWFNYCTNIQIRIQLTCRRLLIDGIVRPVNTGMSAQL